MIVVLKKKQHNLALHTFKLPASTKPLLRLKSVKYIFDDSSKLLLGYRTEFRCRYFSQQHNFISTVWLWSIDEYVIYWFWAKVHL